jgi:1,4-alpha-glucan branching enzyme
MIDSHRNPETSSLENLLRRDPYLVPHRATLERRLRQIHARLRQISQGTGRLREAADLHHRFGLQRETGGWVFREWAPNATAVAMIGEMTNWQEVPDFELKPAAEGGIWELRLPPDAMKHGDLFRLRIGWPEGRGDRIPAFATRVVQDPETLIFNAQVWAPPDRDRDAWKHPEFRPHREPPLIYEVHIGMAQEAERIGSFREFTQNILPRITESGYNTIQVMAIQEHPYYASFGYQVSSFYAVSSRFGTPDDFKELVDTAHGFGLNVLMDLVHSHAVSNEVEGLSRFDGTEHLYFHAGSRGRHPAWDSRCFDYGKEEVIRFLLSNCRFWLEEYQIDGFRFDGVTSMIYRHHGLEKAFVSYDDYFDDSVDEDALTYLALANQLIQEIRPGAVAIAEDVSGMPGLAASSAAGGIGFDYRFAMGIADNWIRWVKEVRDEDWPIGRIWFELNNRRKEEKTISYTESHDQALVGDQTLIFRMIGPAIYDCMTSEDWHFAVDRGVALHKMIRLITLATAGSGYLNFMGNEFGHPEWVDFPREGNGWSYRYAKRQWHLADDPSLKYHCLGRFDRDMLALVKAHHVLENREIYLRHEHEADKVLAFQRAGLLFVFNFHPSRSLIDHPVAAAPCSYRMVFDSDARRYGGHARLQSDQIHFTMNSACEGDSRRPHLSLYLPTRTAIVLEMHEQDTPPS